MTDDQAPPPAPAKPAAEVEKLAAPQAVATTTVSVHFKMIFLAVFSLTVALLIVRVSVAIMVGNPSESLKEAMSTCSLLGNAGFGAILGLIGGKIS
jgi:hypothetical protein